VFLAAAYLLGDSVGSRRAYIREIEEKADRLEREREIETRRAAAEEQARIARELHDVVAHALSVIVVQASAAADAFDVEPRLVGEPIRSIETAARSALADLRRVLGVLQRDTDYAPQPGLARLDELLGQVRATGLEVELEVRGSAKRLPRSVDLSAYRIIQEALTNTLKHARAERARVFVRYGDSIQIEISDDGQGANGAQPGSGLVGMRERVALLGGAIETGSLPGRGYRVAASIPTGEVE
ncbi:MAG: sensor histidine kinase, partial [Gaiellaceae bacterium]